MIDKIRQANRKKIARDRLRELHVLLNDCPFGDMKPSTIHNFFVKIYSILDFMQDEVSVLEDNPVPFFETCIRESRHDPNNILWLRIRNGQIRCYDGKDIQFKTKNLC